MIADDYKTILRHDFASFISFAFNELNPFADYQHNWHIDVMAYHLSKVESGECKRLIINMPPRMLKSHCASVALPAWILGRNPSKNLLYLHNSRALGRELEDSCVNLMASRRYRSLFPSTIIQESSAQLKTSHGGGRKYMPLMGRLAGLGSDIIIVDDPISTSDVRNISTRTALHNQFDENVLQRLNSKKTGAIILVMQRLHEDDLTAHLLAKNEDWALVNLPAIALHDETWALPHDQTYHRKKGEALHHRYECREQLIETLTSIGGYSFAYQYLQGAYETHFGETGEGGVWLYPLRTGEFWDMQKSPTRSYGAYHMNETDFILPRVFNIGDDPIPDNMRNKMTLEEFTHNARYLKDALYTQQ